MNQNAYPWHCIILQNGRDGRSFVMLGGHSIVYGAGTPAGEGNQLLNELSIATPTMENPCKEA